MENINIGDIMQYITSFQLISFRYFYYFKFGIQ